METKSFTIDGGIEVVCAKYQDQAEDNPFILDVSVEVEPGFDYSVKSGYQTATSRDCAYCEFDEISAQKFYDVGVKFINA